MIAASALQQANTFENDSILLLCTVLTSYNFLNCLRGALGSLPLGEYLD